MDRLVQLSGALFALVTAGHGGRGGEAGGRASLSNGSTCIRKVTLLDVVSPRKACMVTGEKGLDRFFRDA